VITPINPQFSEYFKEEMQIMENGPGEVRETQTPLMIGIIIQVI